MEKDILKQLYQKYRKEIYLYLYSLCKNSSLAEDLLQETFLKSTAFVCRMTTQTLRAMAVSGGAQSFFQLLSQGKMRKYRLV